MDPLLFKSRGVSSFLLEHQLRLGCGKNPRLEHRFLPHFIEICANSVAIHCTTCRQNIIVSLIEGPTPVPSNPRASTSSTPSTSSQSRATQSQSLPSPGGDFLACPGDFHVFEPPSELKFKCIRCQRTFFVLPSISPFEHTYWQELSNQALTTQRHERLLNQLSRYSQDLLLGNQRQIRLLNSSFVEMTHSIPRSREFLQALGFREEEKGGEKVLTPPPLTADAMIRVKVCAAEVLAELAKLVPPEVVIGNPNKALLFKTDCPRPLQRGEMGGIDDVAHYLMLGCVPWMEDDDIAETYNASQLIPFSRHDPLGHKALKCLIALAAERGRAFFMNLATDSDQFEAVNQSVQDLTGIDLPAGPSREMNGKNEFVPSEEWKDGRGTEFQGTDRGTEFQGFSVELPVNEDDSDNLEAPPLRNTSVPCGLVNQGNTCYINSALQLLFSLKPFWAALLSLPQRKANVATEAALPSTSLLYELKELAGTGKKCLSVSKALMKLITSHSSFKRGRHEDVTELLDFIFEAMEENEKILQAPELGKALNSFVGILENSFESPELKRDSKDLFRRLILNITGHDTLEASLKEYTSPVQAVRHNQVGELQVTIRTLPDFLIFHLEESKSRKTTKNQGQFRFPEKIDLSPFSSAGSGHPQAPIEYQLIGVVVHSGTADMGHYWTFSYSIDLGWVKLNDSKVSPASFASIEREGFGGEDQSSSAYCLCYAHEDFVPNVHDRSNLRQEVALLLGEDVVRVAAEADVQSSDEDDVGSGRVVFNDAGEMGYEPTAEEVEAAFEAEWICSICEIDEDAEGNDIIACDMCGKKFHQQCHNPPVPSEETAEETWYCAQCKLHHSDDDVGALPPSKKQRKE